MLLKPHAAFFGFLVAAALLPGCQMAPATLSNNHQREARAVAHAFVDAIRAADAEQLHQLTAQPDPSDRELSEAVIGSTVSERQVQRRLGEAFGFSERRESVIAGDAWLAAYQNAAEQAPLQQQGDRVRIGEVDSPTYFYLRLVGGAWKVEMIPTLVPESGGEVSVGDPVVTYRYGVSKALNEWLLGKFAAHELASKSDYDKARNAFWLQYLTHAASGSDPHDTLLPTLPSMPKDALVARD